MKMLVLGDFQGKFPFKLKRKIEKIKDEIDFIVGLGDYAGIDEWKPYIMKYIKIMKVSGRQESFEDFVGRKKYNSLMKKDFELSKKVCKILDSFGKPIHYIFGNSDDEWYNYPFGGKIWKIKKSKVNLIKKLNNFKSLNYRKRKIKGINFVGFGGYMDIEAYFDKKEWKGETGEQIQNRKNRHKKAEKKLFDILKKTKKGTKGNENPLIFVLHYPPYGVFDIIKAGKNNPMNKKSAGVKFFTSAIKKYKPLLVFCGHMHEYKGMKKFHNTLVINPGEGGKGKAAVVEINIDKNKRGKIKNMKFL